MPRSSDNVAALAAALAKAQIELTNPDKSLVATLAAERGQPARSFRYASLASGLDIVRSTLGRHEIAILQSTAIDRDSGLIKLTTTLAHASGEWIASDWPVCALAELPAPHRMGAALSYARRYALFTLVGIAGEDDLDAPDLPLQSATPPPTPSPPLSPSLRGNNGRSPRPQPNPIVTLDPDVSVRQRDELLHELASITSFDAAAEWAKRILPTKNTLTATDARGVEDAWRSSWRKSAIDWARRWPSAAAQTDAPTIEFFAVPAGEVSGAGSVASPSLQATAALDFETYAVTPKTRRRRDKRHRAFVAAQACLICGGQPSDAHHLRFAQPRGLGLKVSDEFTVPLCRMHHRELHGTPNEMRWWGQFGIQPLSIAYKLWTTTHPAPPDHRAAGDLETPAVAVDRQGLPRSEGLSPRSTPSR